MIFTSLATRTAGEDSIHGLVNGHISNQASAQPKFYKCSKCKKCIQQDYHLSMLTSVPLRDGGVSSRSLVGGGCVGSGRKLIYWAPFNLII